MPHLSWFHHKGWGIRATRERRNGCHSERSEEPPHLHCICICICIALHLLLHLHLLFLLHFHLHLLLLFYFRCFCFCLRFCPLIFIFDCHSSPMSQFLL